MTGGNPQPFDGVSKEEPIEPPTSPSGVSATVRDITNRYWHPGCITNCDDRQLDD